MRIDCTIIIVSSVGIKRVDCMAVVVVTSVGIKRLNVWLTLYRVPV